MINRTSYVDTELGLNRETFPPVKILVPLRKLAPGKLALKTMAILDIWIYFFLLFQFYWSIT